MSAPIGVFDSGYGGLTILKELKKQLPQYDYTYLGDNARAPYGSRSFETVYQYTLEAVNWFFKQGCSLVIIACNTASSLGYQDLKDFLGDKIPILNVIDPVVSFCKNQTHYRKIGVIGTKATIKSDIYAQKLKLEIPNIKVQSLATPLLAPMIEEGFFNNNISKTIINAYLSSTKLKNIDSIILACTHYPLIREEINDYFKGKVEILNTAKIVADDVKNKLETLNILNTKISAVNHLFYVSDKTTAFEQSTKLFFKDKIDLKLKNIWDK